MRFSLAFILLAFASFAAAWKVSVYEHPKFNAGNRPSKLQSNFVGISNPGRHCITGSKFEKLRKSGISSLKFWPENKGDIFCNLQAYKVTNCKPKDLTQVLLVGDTNTEWPNLLKKQLVKVRMWPAKWRGGRGWEDHINSLLVVCDDYPGWNKGTR